MCRNFQISDKVSFLRRPSSYAEPAARVEVKETHMSWVFLTDRAAYKLKKPVRNDYLDFSTVEARHTDSLREVELNRRLAHNVYRGVVPLTAEPNGGMQLDGDGQPIDWLVKMRRLPAERMLDWAIEHHTARQCDVRSVARLLAGFYEGAPTFPIAPAAYREQLESGLNESCRELLLPEYGQSETAVNQVHDTARAFLQAEAEGLETRVRQGRVIDAHGDLRPEHICLEEEPVVIDCLQFNRDLRVLDAASELSFLTLECERLGAPHLSAVFWNEYLEVTGDRPPTRLLVFYSVFHACVRAKIAVWHFKEDDVQEPNKWKNRARDYLRIAQAAQTQNN